MSRLTRIGVALSYLSLAAVPLYGASIEKRRVPAVAAPAAPETSRVELAPVAAAGATETLPVVGAKIPD